MARANKDWPPLLNFKELCEYLGKSEAIVRRIVSNNGHLFIKDKFYSLALVDVWLQTPERVDYDYGVSSVEREADKMISQVMGVNDQGK